MKTARGDWHRRNQRGGAPPRVAGAGNGGVSCSFCEKKFDTADAARQHERDYHAKLLKRLISTEPTSKPRLFVTVTDETGTVTIVRGQQ